MQVKVEDRHVHPADILYVGAAVTYSTILIKVFVMLEYAVETGARWLLKTDDDAYVNIPQSVQVRPACSLSSPALIDTECGLSRTVGTLSQLHNVTQVGCWCRTC